MNISAKATPVKARAALLRRLVRALGLHVRALVLVGLAGLAVVLCLPLISAFASSPPRIGTEIAHEEVYATHAFIDVGIELGGLEVKWHAEYSTGPNGPWVPANSGTFEAKSTLNEIYLGADPPDDTLLHHLTPSTTYYARFTAENSAKETATPRIFTFTTTPVTKPEVTELPPVVGGPARVFSVAASSPTFAVAKAQIESNGLETKYVFEYAPAEANGQEPAEASSSWVPFGPAATGTVTAAEDFAVAEATVATLTPATKYYPRVKLTNAKGTAIVTPGGEYTVEDHSFSTPTNRPVASKPEVRNVTGTTAHFEAVLLPHDLETEWHFEYATSAAGPWKSVVGAEGIVSQAEAEALPEFSSARGIEGSLTGLNPSTTYYVRLFAESEAGEGRNGSEEPIATEKQGIASFKTFGAPTVATLAVHGLHGEALRLIGAVNPGSVPTSGEQTISVVGAPTGGTFTLTFKGQTTAPIAFDAPEGVVANALSALSTVGEDGVDVNGADGGPYKVFFAVHNGEVVQPQITADASGLTPSSAVSVVTDAQGGEGLDTHYHFEYVAQKQFEKPGGEGGFAKASSTPEVDLGSGDSTEYVGADLPALEPGESYRFRTVATNNSTGNPVVDGEEQSLRVPVAAVVASEAAGACPNEAVRTGPSALLPDCRAFEQLTPVDKAGAQESFNYGGSFGFEGVAASEDGNHLEYGSPAVKWGTEPDPGQSPYFFSRTDTGWQMTAGTVQPEAGIFSYRAQVLDPDLSEFAFIADWATSNSATAANVEFKAGPPGGPYVTVASVPAAQAPPGWVAASEGFSKLVLQVADHSLIARTHTQEGYDLYEYSKGELRQANVTGPGAGTTIGSCGARIASRSNGLENASAGGESVDLTEPALTDGKQNAVSDDGSRVFFEAVPGKDCSEALHLYVRVDGGEDDAETVDIGAYRFVVANKQGTEALLEKSSGENPGLYRYKSGSPPEFLPSSGIVVGAASAGSVVSVSEDLSTVYIDDHVGEHKFALYRYDVASEKLSYVTEVTYGDDGFHKISPEGRYLYFAAETVAGLPGGGKELEQAAAAEKGQTTQVYRYDSAEASVECMSCASSHDPEPRLSSLFGGNENSTIASTNGDYVFFDTPAALLPSDVDGEVAPESVRALGGEHGSSAYSLSSDVYEWRRDGIDGCAHLQGCLALITTGNGGFLNILLGIGKTGNDVFFATKESLLSSDNDTAEDIYDARVNGGFPEASRPVECAGDACSTPFAPPSEITPSSATFQGAGNLSLTPSPAKSKAKPKPAAKPGCKAKEKKKCKAKRQRRKKKTAKKATRPAKVTRRAGR